MNVAKTLTVAVVAAWVAFAAPAAAEAQQDGERLPTELWEEYPLDPTEGQEPQQSDAPRPTTTAERSGPPAAQPPSSVSQEEGSNLWKMLGMTIGLAALAGILAALVVVGASSILARGRPRWMFIRALGSAPKRARTSGRLLEEGLRSEVGSLVAFAERSRGATFGRRSRKVPVPKKAAQPAKEAAPAPNETAPAPNEVAPPRLRTSRKTRPKKLPTAGAPPPKKQLPGLSPPKKEGLITAGLPPGKALGPTTRAPHAKAGEQPEGPGPRPDNALSPRLEPPTRGRRSDAGRPTLRQDR
jgi:hypothetical protein